MSAPLLKTIMPVESKDSQIRQLKSFNGDELNQIVALHLGAFKELFIGQLGKGFGEFYYSHIMKHPVGTIFVWKDNGKIVGFVAGIADDEGFLNFQFMIEAIKGMAIGCVTNLKIWRSLCRFAKEKFVLSTPCKAELLSIVVDPMYRGRGIGKQLVQALEEFMRQKLVKEYKVSTDTQFSTGHQFYQNLSMTLVKEANLFGLTKKMYLKKLS